MQYQKISDILSKMLLAVALSDNLILPNEINYILQKGGSEILSQKINLLQAIAVRITGWRLVRMMSVRCH